MGQIRRPGQPNLHRFRQCQHPARGPRCLKGLLAQGLPGAVERDVVMGLLHGRQDHAAPFPLHGEKAKELRRLAEHLITLAKRGDLHARRQALAVIREKDVVHKLFDEANEKFGQSGGGYTRIVKLGRRAGDAAPMSLIELIVPDAGRKKKTKKKGAKTEAAKAKTETSKKADAKVQNRKKPAKKEAVAKAKKEPKANPWPMPGCLRQLLADFYVFRRYDGTAI